MNFEVYCDEAYPDLFSSSAPPARYLVIGSLWLRSEDRVELKARIQSLRNTYGIGSEFKWRKVTPSKEHFYLALAELFYSFGEQLRFRCIAVDHTQVDLVRFHQSDQELGFYKFYYQLLHHWIDDFNEYAVYCDLKTSRLPGRLATLRDCLANANLSSSISRVQAIDSGQSVVLQLADVLTGAVAARLNDRLRPGGAKARVVTAIEGPIGHRIAHTVKAERKFNVFVIDLRGGW